MRVTGIGLVILVGAAAAGAQPLPLADDFQVNTLTAGYQDGADLGVAANGDFVVVWHSPVSAGTDQDNNSVQARRFLADGTPLGLEFQVNTYTSGFQGWPAVAVRPSGEFAVVWFTERSDDGTVRGQVFDSRGDPLGGEFQVNTYTTGYQGRPDVATGALGDFVVVWESNGQDGSLKGVFGQRFASDGAILGSEFQVNTYTTEYQEHVAVSAADDGEFIVVWSSFGQDGSGHGIFAQRFAANGTMQDDEFQVNTHTPATQWSPDVSVDTDGDFVVVWGSYGQDGSDFGVFGQRVASDGSPIAEEFPINSHTTASQGFPAVATDSAGGFVVVWESYSRDGSKYGVAGQQFYSNGLPQGTEFLVNSYTPDTQYAASIDFNADSQFVVVWASYASAGTDDDGSSTQVRRFLADGVFVDGFESSNTSAWPMKVP